MGRMTRAEAYKIRKIVELASASLDDKTASMAPTLFPKMPIDDKQIPAGTRICWNGEVLKAAVTCWGREDNNPDNAPSLWEKLSYKDGIRLIPGVITVTGAFAKGEQGWWKEKRYESLFDGNVYTPDQYPNNWKIIE